MKVDLTKNSPVDMVGDGKTPNLYWVSVSNDFQRVSESGNIEGIEDCPALQSVVGKSEGETVAVFDTFKEALAEAREQWPGNDKPEKGPDAINRVTIEDRLSGEVYQRTFIASKGDWGWDFEDDESQDTRFTQETIEKAGGKFA